MKSFILLYAAFAFVLHCNAQTDSYFPPNTGDEWETLPIDSLNWCQDRVDDMVNFVEDNDSKAFMILKDGKIVVEEYFGEFTQDSVWYWASAGKTLSAFLMGMAVEEGVVNLDDPVSDYLGEGWTSCTPEQEEAITVWNQITMTTGLDDSETADCTDPECLTYLAEAGSRWAYHNGPYTLSQDVIEAATGQNINVNIFQNLTQTTGITGTFVQVEYNSVMFSNPRSFARFGHLLLNEGVWNGNDLLGDNSFFEDMTTSSQDLNLAYGYLTWLNGQDSFLMPTLQFEFDGSIIPNAPEDMFSALGKNDQILDVVPSMGLVVMRMGDVAGSESLVPTTFNNELWEYINNLECDISVDELQTSNVSVFPNPAVNELNIFGVNALQYEILNTQGKQVLSSNETTQSIDVSSIPEGIYVLKIHTKSAVISKKVVISRL